MTVDHDNNTDAPGVIHYFVDEAGDPVLFDGKGRVLVGNEGCSKYFIVGKLDVDDPDGLGVKLEALRAELLADPYFKRVPSMQPERGKTCAMFHAKDDAPEVRQAVFKLLRELDLRFYAVVRDKSALVKAVRVRNAQEPHYRYRPDEQYDGLISDLFRHFHGTADITRVCFARRSKRNRTAALYTALERAKEEFSRSFSFAMPGAGSKSNAVRRWTVPVCRRLTIAYGHSSGTTNVGNLGIWNTSGRRLGRYTPWMKLRRAGSGCCTDNGDRCYRMGASGHKNAVDIGCAPVGTHHAAWSRISSTGISNYSLRNQDSQVPSLTLFVGSEHHGNQSQDIKSRGYRTQPRRAAAHRASGLPGAYGMQAHCAGVGFMEIPQQGS